MGKKVLIILFLCSTSIVQAKGSDTSKVHIEAHAVLGKSTYFASPSYFPLKRGFYRNAGLSILFGKGKFKFVAGGGYHSIMLKHYPVLIKHETDGYIEGTWTNHFNYYTIDLGVSVRPFIKKGVEFRQVIGMTAVRQVFNKYEFPGYDNGLVLKDRGQENDFIFYASASVGYFFPLRKTAFGINITVNKRFEKYIPMFNYGAAFIIRYSI